MYDFVNSNSFIALVTFGVGFSAICLYLKQKIDHKRDAAKLILQEIRYAEGKIRKYREVNKYKLYDKLLPTNSWNDNIHLFIKDLKEVQNLDLISDFYGKASYIDTIIATISRQKNDGSMPATSEFPVVTALSNPPAGMPQVSPSSQVPQMQTVIELPLFSQKILRVVSMSVEFIYNTPVVEKLRQISEKKWYHIL
jgi:hypothetical protein